MSVYLFDARGHGLDNFLDARSSQWMLRMQIVETCGKHVAQTSRWESMLEQILTIVLLQLEEPLPEGVIVECSAQVVDKQLLALGNFGKLGMCRGEVIGTAALGEPTDRHIESNLLLGPCGRLVMADHNPQLGQPLEWLFIEDALDLTFGASIRIATQHAHTRAKLVMMVVHCHIVQYTYHTNTLNSDLVKCRCI